MTERKILFIVEGEQDELKFLKQMIRTCYPGIKHEFYSYKTTLHTLAQVLDKEYPDFEKDDIDIKLVLKSMENDADKRAVLSQKYNDIYLVFDFEPQHDNPHFDTIRRMLGYFQSSSDTGRLYLNYPMIQSYKHITVLPDPIFSFRKIALKDVYRYKEIVGRESIITDLNFYTYSTFVSLGVHHIKKANYLVTGRNELPTVSEYLTLNHLDIFDVEYTQLTNEKVVSILNTSLFLFVDFKPEAFFREVTTNTQRFDI